MLIINNPAYFLLTKGRLLFVITTFFMVANEVFATEDNEWMNVGTCGVGLVCDPSCQLLCLKIHNYYRKLHGSPPLRCNHELAESAQNWSDEMAKQGKMRHSPWTDRYTESISWKGWGWSGMDKMEGAIPGAVRSWYEEVKNYNYETGQGNGRVVGHFRAIVWKAGTHLGCGLRVVPEDGTYVTAHYAPASHASYEYYALVPYNVLPRKETEPSCDIRSTERELCDDETKAPFVLPDECIRRGCCYDDVFLSEPGLRSYSMGGRTWCYLPKGGKKPLLN